MQSTLPEANKLPVALAIDPGRAKCGVAVVRQDGEVLHRSIIVAENLVSEARALIDAYDPVIVLIGIGTGSKPLAQALEESELAVPLQRVDEAHTSEAARKRYVASNSARGWQRLLPRSLRIPDRPYDDYVAVILAERFWKL